MLVNWFKIASNVLEQNFQSGSSVSSRNKIRIQKIKNCIWFQILMSRMQKLKKFWSEVTLGEVNTLQLEPRLQ